jgi:hypothetical protein
MLAYRPDATDFDHRHLGRVPGLQVRRDIGDAELELLERHAGDDAGALDGAGGRDRVDRRTECAAAWTSGAVGAMHHPALARSHFQVDAAQDVHVVDEHVGVPQLHQRTPRSRSLRGGAHARGTAVPPARNSSTARPARIAPARWTRPRSSSAGGS